MIKKVSFFMMTALLSTSYSTAWADDQALSPDEAAALQALDDALPGRLIHNPFDLDWSLGGNDVQSRIVDADALTTGKAIRVRVKKAQVNPWDSHLSIQIPQAVESGDEVQVYYWVRTHRAARGKDGADITLFLGRNAEPYDNIISERLTPSDEWKLASVTGTANRGFRAGLLKLEYQLGRNAQSVEFGPVYVSVLD